MAGQLIAGYGMRQRVGLFMGPLALITLLAFPAPDGMAPQAWAVAGVALFMAIWWVTEAIPIPATALLPIVLFPVLGVGSIADATRPFANPLIFLFLGGFIIALAMEKTHLHRRIALNIVSRVGTRSTPIILGFMAAAAFLSMWVSKTATAAAFLPVLASVAIAVGHEPLLLVIPATVGASCAFMLPSPRHPTRSFTAVEKSRYPR